TPNTPKTACLFQTIFNGLYHPRRIAAYQRVRSKIAGYYGPRRYNGVVSDGDASYQDGVGRYPDISPNHNRISNGDRAAQGWGKRMTGCEDAYIGTNHYIVTDRYATQVINGAILVDKYTFAHA